jgi:hypothetical protein
VRWRRHGRAIVRRVKLARGAMRKPSTERWVIVRADGFGWVGPYRYQGNTFVRSQDHWYGYGTESAARRAWEELGGDNYSGVRSRKISVLQIH